MSATPPRTTFVGGVNPFDALAVFLTTPPKKSRTMKPKTPGRPAKPATAKTLPKDEDYSTPYQPPVPTVTYPLAAIQPEPAPTPAPATHKACTVLPALDDIQIDDDVPIPDVCRRPDAKARVATLTALLGKLEPGKSAALPLGVYATLNKVVSATHKTGPARFATRKDKTAQTLRVWRVS